MSQLTIRFARRADGAVVLDLRRDDGTSTWQKRTGPVAEFFVVHDLTHYAVETTLGLTGGFYGLVAAGWDLADFGTPWPRGPLPDDALPAEVIVGCFDAQRATGERLTAEQCNTSVADYFARLGRRPPIEVSDVQLDAIRTALSDLVSRWHSVTPGEELELSYAPSR